MGEHVPEFMRYTAPDPDALMRDIGFAREKLANAVREKNALAIVDHAADLGSMLTTARKEAEAVQLLQAHASIAEQNRFDEAEERFKEALAIRVRLGEPRQERSREALQLLIELRRNEGCNGV